MIIGIVSDTHNDLENLIKAVNVFESLGIDTIIHCGDVTIPRIFEALKSFRIYLSFGNMDIDKEMLTINLKQYSEYNQAGDFLDIVICGKRLFMMHGDDDFNLHRAIKSGDYDYVFSGHTHRRRDERIGKTRVINPGALGGAFFEQRSIAYLDLETDQLVYYFLQ